MKNRILIPLLLICFSLSSCEIAGEIYKFGIWSGIMAVLLFVGLVFWLMNRAKSKRGSKGPNT